jgi:hypothetical protein
MGFVHEIGGDPTCVSLRHIKEECLLSQKGSPCLLRTTNPVIDWTEVLAD